MAMECNFNLNENFKRATDCYCRFGKELFSISNVDFSAKADFKNLQPTTYNLQPTTYNYS